MNRKSAHVRGGLHRHFRTHAARRSTRRRILVATAAWPVITWLDAALAQSKQPVLIGWLAFGSSETGMRMFVAFKEGLAALGWKEGVQVRVEGYWPDGQEDRLSSLAQDLVAKKPALIVAWAMRTAVVAAKRAPMIPLVIVSGNDPVAAGLVTNLARPGGMITGVAGFGIEFAGKYLELLLAAVPKVKRVGFLAYANNPNHARTIEAARRSVTQHSVEAQFVAIASSDEIEPAMSRLAKEGVQALVVLPGAIFIGAELRRIQRLALAQRWPVVGGSALAAAGGLLSYDADPVASARRAAYYVDRILRGTKPGDLPIEQPTQFEMVVNLKTAKELGITIPEKVLLRADRVIE